jgi:methanogenesis marker radical SAM protein
MFLIEILALVGGTPGIDCGSFCEFCYFKAVDYNNLNEISLGCRYCPPNQFECDNCSMIKKEVKSGFKSPNQVLEEFKKDLFKQESLGLVNFEDLKINLGSWADIINYPHLKELISSFKELELPVHLGYTSGKSIHNEKMAENIISMGIDEISFSVFSTDPSKRKNWMNDKTPEESLKALKMFCETIDVNGSTVVIPDIIDKEEIFSTLSTLEEWGIKTFILSRFANFVNQGLILNNKPTILGLNTQSIEEFHNLVKEAADEFKFRIIGIPASDPKNDIPFILSKKKNKEYLEQLNLINSRATILTSKLSAPYLKKILGRIDQSGNCKKQSHSPWWGTGK